MLEKLRMLNDDVLMMELDKSLFRPTDSLIVYTESKDTRSDPKNKLRYYEVKVVGPKCKEVKVGDKVLVSWLDTTPPISIESVRYTLTTEKKICGILTT